MESADKATKDVILALVRIFASDAFDNMPSAPAPPPLRKTRSGTTMARAKGRSLTRAVSLTNRNLETEDPAAATVGVPLTLVLCERDDSSLITADSLNSVSSGGVPTTTTTTTTASSSSGGATASSSSSSSTAASRSSGSSEWFRSAFQSCPPGMAAVLPLHPLSVEHVEELLSRLYFHPTFIEQYAARIHSEARGNPLWLTLVLQAIAKTDNLTWQPGAQQSGWCFSPGKGFDTIKLPNEISGVLAQRLERLPDRDKQLLQAAALLGVEFDISILCEVIRKEPLVVLRQLQRLEKEEQIVMAATDSEDVSRFASGGFVDALLLMGGLSREYTATATSKLLMTPTDIQDVLEDRDLVAEIISATTQLQRQYHLQIADVLANRLKRGSNNFDKVRRVVAF